MYSCGHFMLAAPTVLPPLRPPRVLPVTAAEVRSVLGAYRLPAAGPAGRSNVESRRLRTTRVRTAVSRVVDRVTADLRRELAATHAAYVELVEQALGNQPGGGVRE